MALEVTKRSPEFECLSDLHSYILGYQMLWPKVLSVVVSGCVMRMNGLTAVRELLVGHCEVSGIKLN